MKSGDAIFWRANRNILKPVPSAGGSQSTSPKSVTTATDKASVANELKTAAHLAVSSAAAAYAKAPSQALLEALQAAQAAANQSDTEADTATLAKAAAEAAVPAAPKATIGQTTVTAALDTVESAAAEASAADKKQLNANDNTLSDQSNAAKANNAVQSLNDKATKSAADAKTARAEAQQANAYLDAAAAAYQKVAADSIQTTLCAPAGSRFEVTSLVAATAASTDSKTSAKTSSAKTSDSSTVAASNTQLVQGVFPSRFEFFHRQSIPTFPPPRKPGDSQDPPIGTASPCGAGTQVASYDTLYEFTGDELKTNDFERLGFTWGGLVVPFKFYFTDKSIKPNASLLGFVGYEGWFTGVSIATVLAAGLGVAQISSTASPTSATATTSSTTTTSNTTAATYSFSLGFIATFGGTVKAGVMFGRDYQGNPSAFPFENKTWMALSIGAGF